MSKHKIELEILALSHSALSQHSYAILLGEMGGVRKIPIIIATAEAHAIAVTLERLEHSRPLTHDLMKNMMVAFGVELVEVLIYKIEEGIFYSRLICTSADGQIEIDSRTSDAIALALRFNVSIFTTENVLSVAGSSLHSSKDAAMLELPGIEDITEEDGLSTLSTAELQDLLNEVLEQEDYIQAAKIRDEINNRK